MGNPYEKWRLWMIWGENPPFSETHILYIPGFPMLNSYITIHQAHVHSISNRTQTMVHFFQAKPPEKMTKQHVFCQFM